MKLKLISLLMFVVLATLSFTGCGTLQQTEAALGNPAQVQTDVITLGKAARSHVSSAVASQVHRFATILVQAASLDLAGLAAQIPKTGNAQADALVTAGVAFIQLAAAKYGAQSATTLAYAKAVGQGLISSGFYTMAFFGLIDEKAIGEGSVEEAHRAVNDAMDRIDPLLTKVYMMARALLHGVINRFKVSVHFEILPDPGENPPPKEKQQY